MCAGAKQHDQPSDAASSFSSTAASQASSGHGYGWTSLHVRAALSDLICIWPRTGVSRHAGHSLGAHQSALPRCKPGSRCAQKRAGSGVLSLMRSSSWWLPASSASVSYWQAQIDDVLYVLMVRINAFVQPMLPCHRGHQSRLASHAWLCRQQDCLLHADCW